MTPLLTLLLAMLLRLPEFVHVGVFAPAGAGKTTSLAIPVLFDWPKAAVVLDVKGELFEATALWRARAFGHRVVCLDPFGSGGDRFNVLDGVDYRSPHFLPDVRALAEALVVKAPDNHEGGKHFEESAELWISSLLAFTVWDSKPADRHLQTLRSVFTDPELLAAAVGRLCRADDEILRRLGNQILAYRDRELSSTQTTTNRHLSWLDSPAVAEFTRRSSFDPRELLDPEGRMTIYVVVPPQYLRSENRLLRAVVTALLRTVVRGGVDRRREVLFLLDEFPALGRQEIILDALTQYRAFGVRLILIAQALSQWQLCFPEAQVQTALANCDQLFFGVRDYQTAEYVSQRLGQATVPVVSEQHSRSHSYPAIFGDRQQEQYSRSWSTTVSEAGRPLLTPGEVMQLGTRAVLFAQNTPPLVLELRRWFEDPAFRGQGREALSPGVALACLAVLVAALFLAGLVTRHAFDAPATVPPPPPASSPFPWSPVPFPDPLPPPAPPAPVGL